MTTTGPLPGSQPPNFAVPIANSKPLQPKKHPITNDYTILTRCLGVGVNGKVLECIHKATGERKALKVSGDSELKYNVVCRAKGGVWWASIGITSPHTCTHTHILVQRWAKLLDRKLKAFSFFAENVFFSKSLTWLRSTSWNWSCLKMQLFIGHAYYIAAASDIYQTICSQCCILPMLS